MTPEEKQLLISVAKKLEDFLNVYYKTHFVDKDIFNKKTYFNQTATFNIPFSLKDGSTISLGSGTGGKIGATGDKLGFLGATPVARQSAITSPSGGATIDSQARNAIDSIRTVLINFGLTS